MSDREQYRVWRNAQDPHLGSWVTADYSKETVDGLIIERNVAVPVSDGTIILVDLYRPENVEKVPLIIGWGPYGKHRNHEIPGNDVDPAWVSKFISFEAPDPGYWAQHGYGVVIADPRGSWGSGGRYIAHDVQEIDDCYDVIEWLAEQPWSTGRIGMSGVSYLAETQWLVAARRPPHLFAINPWEGFTNAYADHAYHDGILEVPFHKGWSEDRMGFSPSEDTFAEALEHPLLDDYWRGRIPDLENIVVPAYVVASWTDHGLHTRGTLRGFTRISSEHKWLDVHGQKKWYYYYRPDNVERLRLFFDRFLLERETEVDALPRVRLQIRDVVPVKTIERTEWPLTETTDRVLHLDAATATLLDETAATEADVSYAATDANGISFDYTATDDFVIAGTLHLNLWLGVDDYDDADLFVAIQKIGANGVRVQYPFFAVRTDGDLALGWLRASHRDGTSAGFNYELDHTRETKIPAGSVVAVSVEIWPTADLVTAGETLRLIIRGRDIAAQLDPGSGVKFGQKHASYVQGHPVIHTGPERDSHLVIPTLPTSVLSE